jgi:hypothetical protein
MTDTPIELSNIRKDAVLVYSVGRTMLSAGAFDACRAAAMLGTWPYMHTSAYWCLSLTLAIGQATKNNFKYVIACDGDTVFTWKHLAYLYTAAELRPDLDAIAALQMKRQSEAVLFNVNERGVTAMDAGQELVPATLAHFGLTILRTKALMEVPRPWFLRLANPDKPGESIDEDVYFWNQWIKHGKTVAMATRCPVGHVEEFVTWPDESLKPTRQLWADYYQTQTAPAEARKSSWDMANESNQNDL